MIDSKKKKTIDGWSSSLYKMALNLLLELRGVQTTENKYGKKTTEMQVDTRPVRA